MSENRISVTNQQLSTAVSAQISEGINVFISAPSYGPVSFRPSLGRLWAPSTGRSIGQARCLSTKIQEFSHPWKTQWKHQQRWISRTWLEKRLEFFTLSCYLKKDFVFHSFFCFWKKKGLIRSPHSIWNFWQRTSEMCQPCLTEGKMHAAVCVSHRFLATNFQKTTPQRC